MLEKRTWQEFQETGLLFYINQILHAFGYAIVCEYDDGKITSAYPARSKFRGFTESSVVAGYKRIGKYLEEYAKELRKESDL